VNIVTDWGPQFMSHYCRAFWSLFGSSVSLFSGFLPQSNGQTVTVHLSHASCSSRARCYVCVCECACGRADASALINEPAIIIYTSCSSSDTLYILTTLSSPLSDRCLLFWMFGVPVFSPVRVRVGCAFQIRHGTSGALWIRHGTSGLLFTALI